jgi:hypothetical protein
MRDDFVGRCGNMDVAVLLYRINNGNWRKLVCGLEER